MVEGLDVCDCLLALDLEDGDRGTEGDGVWVFGEIEIEIGWFWLWRMIVAI